MSPVNVARLERAAICDLFDELGPDQPTLCEGWTTRDLAAHLVTRERRPDAAVGILVKPVSGFTEQVRAAAAKRPFEELVVFLFRSQSFPHGAVLLTGTGIVPPDSFTLQPQDTVRISISGIGTLENPVVEV